MQTLRKAQREDPCVSDTILSRNSWLVWFWSFLERRTSEFLLLQRNESPYIKQAGPEWFTYSPYLFLFKMPCFYYSFQFEINFQFLSFGEKTIIQSFKVVALCNSQILRKYKLKPLAMIKPETNKYFHACNITKFFFLLTWLFSARYSICKMLALGSSWKVFFFLLKNTNYPWFCVVTSCSFSNAKKK